MFKKDILRIKIDVVKFLKGHRDGIFHIKMSRPKGMPSDEFEDIKRRINQILDDIKKYL